MLMAESSQDWAKRARNPQRIERIEAFFSGRGFDPHRHDTYAVGRTLAGVHGFSYRKSMRHNLPGGTIVLYPDELHDGEAVTDEGFLYGIIYIEPSMLQQALGGRPLPFIPDGTSRDPRLFRATEVLMQGMDCIIEPLEEDDAERAREYIHSALDRVITLDELEHASGRERWSLSRDFRALYGTSPYRYLTMRRLDHVRALMLAGHTLTDASITAGFTDQSHMTHQFTRTYGLSPARWLRMLRKP